MSSAQEAVSAASSLMANLEVSARGYRLADGESCTGLRLPEYVYELPDPGKWPALMTDPTGRTWDIAAVWILDDEQQALISKIPQVNGAGRTSDFLQACVPASE